MQVEGASSSTLNALVCPDVGQVCGGGDMNQVGPQDALFGDPPNEAHGLRLEQRPEWGSEFTWFLTVYGTTKAYDGTEGAAFIAKKVLLDPLESASDECQALCLADDQCVIARSIQAIKTGDQSECQLFYHSDTATEPYHVYCGNAPSGGFVSCQQSQSRGDVRWHYRANFEPCTPQ